MLLTLSLPFAAPQDRSETGQETDEAARPAGAAVADVPKINYQAERLENGLRVIYAPMGNAPVVHVRLLYHVGSKDESPDRQGFAHMFEHMMFRGSEHVPSERHMELINGVGGNSNAFTSFDQTTYVNTIPSSALELALWLEADRMGGFKVDQEKFTTERKVVNEEYLQRVVNPPYGRMFTDFFALAYEQSHYRWTPIGDMDHLRAADPPELQEFFDTYYVPNNAVLVIAGQFKVEDAKEWVRRYFGWIPAGDEISRRSPSEPPQEEAKRKIVRSLAIPLARLTMGYKTTTYADPDQEVLEVLANILGHGRSSRLYQALVGGSDPIASQLSAGNQRMEETGMFLISVGLLQEKDPDEAQRRVMEVIDRIVKEGVTDEELAKARTQLRLNLLDQRQTASSVATALAEAEAFGGDAALVNKQVERLSKITAADVQLAAKRYLDEKRLSVLQYRPGKAPPQREGAEGGSVDLRNARQLGAVPVLDPIVRQAAAEASREAPIGAIRREAPIGAIRIATTRGAGVAALREDAIRLIHEGDFAGALVTVETILNLDPANEYALSTRPLLQARVNERPIKDSDPPVRVQRVGMGFPPAYPKVPPLPAEVVDADFDMGKSFKAGPVEVVVIHDDRLPLVGMTLLLPGGGDAQPRGKVGLASLTADLLTRGAGGKSAAEWSGALESRGISLNVSDGGDHTRISASFPSDQLDSAAQFVDELLQRPNLDENEFRALKFRSLAGLRQALSNPGSVAGRQMSEALFGDTPEGRQTTPESLASVTLADVEEWFATMYNPPSATLILAGDVSDEQARAFAQKLTKDLKPGQALPFVDYTLPKMERRVIVVDNKAGGQSALRIGGRAFTSDSDEKYAGSVATEILSSGIESRLNRTLRAEKGLTYGASGRFNAGRHAGSFQVGFATKPESTGEAIRSTFQVLEGMVRERVSDEELAEAKRRVTGSLVMNTQTVSQLAGLRANITLNGYPVDYYDQYAEQIAAVTKEQVQQVMAQYASPERLTIVIVAPAEVVDLQLEGVGQKLEIVPMPLERRRIDPAR